MTASRFFVSDNASGIHPEVLAALVSANHGHAVAYGHDVTTARVINVLRGHFGHESEILFALTGTGANVIALQSVLQSWQAVICADCSHLHRDECGAPEKFTGCKVLPAPTQDGKLTADRIAPLLGDSNLVHRARPRIVSVSQCTEWGTVYTPQELAALADYCHGNGMLLHMDGARLANAAVALDLSLQALTADCGIDVVSFGGTKNGLMGAEAVVFIDPSLAGPAESYRKQAMQLASKMRFVAAQFEALFDGDLWRRNARQANAMAARLAGSLGNFDMLRIVMPVQSNAVFVHVPPAVLPALQAVASFAVWDSARSIIRLMASFDTTIEDVDDFIAQIRKVLAS